MSRSGVIRIATHAALALLFGAASVSAETVEFSNTGGITIPSFGPAAPYPSNIPVSGLTGVVSKVTVEVQGLSHGFAPDVAMLLVGPTGHNLVLMSNVGGADVLSNANLVFDDAAAAHLPIDDAITSGSYQPTQVGSPSFAAPAPAPSSATALASFAGGSPNGSWSLYVQDDSAGDAGSVNAWSLVVTTPEPGAGGAAAAMIALLGIRKRAAGRSRR